MKGGRTDIKSALPFERTVPGTRLPERRYRNPGDTNDRPTEPSNIGGIMPILLPCVLIGHFLWNVLTPAHELPVRSEQVMTMLFDAGMFVGLFNLHRAMPPPLFWIALVAGIGLFALRLSDDGWWTGHLVYSLPRR